MTLTVGPAMLEKRTQERRLYDLDFKAQPEFDDGVTAITAILSMESIPPGLIFDTEAFTRTKVQAWISGGENGKTYSAVFSIQTSAGGELVGGFRLMVRDPWVP